MLASQTTLEAEPFRPYDDRYLIARVRQLRPPVEPAAVKHTARARLERRVLGARRELHAARTGRR